MTVKVCTIDGCERPHSGHGYCNAHYQQWRRDKPFTALPEFKPHWCSFPGCRLQVKARKLCGGHLQQQVRGTPLRPLNGWRGTVCAEDGCNLPVGPNTSRCRNHRAQARYRDDDAYREHRKLDSRKRYARDPEFRRKAAEDNKAWRRANPEKLREQRKRYNDRAKERRLTDPEFREHERKLRQQRRQRTGHEYRSLRNVLYLTELQEGKCALCGGWLPEDRSQIHVDHIIPVVGGGDNSLGNLQLTHASCNQSKGVRAR